MKQLSFFQMNEIEWAGDCDSGRYVIEYRPAAKGHLMRFFPYHKDPQIVAGLPTSLATAKRACNAHFRKLLENHTA